jgi:hypothetical protein
MIHDVHGYEKSSFSRDYNRFLAEAGLVRSKSLVGVEIRLFDLAVFQRDRTVKRRTQAEADAACRRQCGLRCDRQTAARSSLRGRRYGLECDDRERAAPRARAPSRQRATISEATSILPRSSRRSTKSRAKPTLPYLGLAFIELQVAG